MKKYNKKNLVASIKNLSEWVENNFDDKEVIQSTWDELVTLLDNIQDQYDDIFGTEGYEHSIFKNN